MHAPFADFQMSAIVVTMNLWSDDPEKGGVDELNY
jgi:hypothetical protein